MKDCQKVRGNKMTKKGREEFNHQIKKKGKETKISHHPPASKKKKKKEPNGERSFYNNLGTLSVHKQIT